MSAVVLKEFKDYAEFSVRADQFFYAVNTYAMNHGNLKLVSSIRPSNDLLEESIEGEIKSDEVKQFLANAVVALDRIKITGIFSDAQDLVPGAIDPDTIPPDLSNFAFYTCFCFQWSLFENFVKTMMQKLIDANVLSSNVKKKLKENWRNTKKFFDIIDSGQVFGHSPFHTILPIIVEGGDLQECKYSDLDKIRALRNDFIHGIESPEILPISPMEKHKYYQRSMWILRQFATNIQSDVQKLLGS